MSAPPVAPAAPVTARLLQTGAPGLFVILWATGFAIAKLGLPYAPPFTILLLRFLAVVAVILPVSLATRAPWPASWRQVGHVAVVGVLLQTAYLGGIYAAIAAGVPSGISALIAGLQPVLTATVVGPFLGERVSGRQWLGLALGFAGVALVLGEKLDFAGAQSWGVLFAVVGLVAITAATLYQKRFCGAVDLRTSAVIQYAAAASTTLPIVALLGWGQVQWTGAFVFALGWLVLVLSLGAVSILTWLIRHGAASRVTSLFYLVPPVAALMGWVMFDERLAPPALLGMALAAAGVALVMRK